MKELTGNSMNVMAVPMADKAANKNVLTPYTEVILIYSEPHYRVDAGGTLIRERTVGDFRFCTSPDNLRRLANNLIEFADETDRQFEEMTNAAK